MSDFVSIDLIPVDFSPKTLCFQDEYLVDYMQDVWYSIEQRAKVEKKGASQIPFFPFDKVVVSPSGNYYAVVTRLGTKGVIYNRERKRIREINRSYYCADHYDYPLAFFQGADNKEYLVHCPEAYNVLHIEEVETGHCLTKRSGKTADVFHSRLEVSSSGDYLLSAGWIWHPIDIVSVYDIEKAIKEPSHLDSFYGILEGMEIYRNEDWMDETAGAFINKEQLLVACQSDSSDNGNSYFLSSVNLKKRELTTFVSVENPIGMMMPISENDVVCFSKYPQMVEIATGKVIEKWPDFQCHVPASSLVGGTKEELQQLSCIALDQKNKRFAMMKDQKTIAIFSFH